MYNYYVQEKLIELENARTARRRWQPRPAGKPALPGVMRAAGGALKRLGDRRESRAAAPEGEDRRIWVRVR